MKNTKNSISPTDRGERTMRSRRKMAVCGLALLLFFTLCGCGAQRQTGEWFAMDTVMTAAVYGSADALDAVEAETYRLDALLAAQKDDSEIAAVNDGAEVVSEETAALLRRALEIAAETNGAYDPTVYPLMRAWGFTDGNYRVPADAELDALLQTTGWTEVSVDGTTTSLPEGFALDLGGIGKGYAAGRCKEILKAHGVTSALLSLGGNVSALGSKPDGTAWTVAIENPDGGAYLGTVQITDQCVVTSGGYQRYFEEDGATYHHIIDPRTGYPADSGVISSTIISHDGTLADGLSTSLFIMGVDDALDYWRAHKEEFDAILMDKDGTVYVTEGIADRCSLLENREMQVVH